MVPFILYTVVILCITVIYILYKNRAKLAPHVKHTDPNTVTWYGSVKQFQRHSHRIHDYIVDISRQIGDTTCWTFGLPFSPPVIVLGCNEQLTQHILTRLHIYPKGKQTERIAELLGHGIFASDGAEWRSQRNIASHIFTSRNIKNDMTAVFSKNTATLLLLLDKYASNKSEFDIQDLYFRYTMECFAEIAFGERPDLLSEQDNSASQAAYAYDRFQALLTERVFNPFWKLYKLLQIGAERDITHNLNIIDQYAYKIIQQKRQNHGDTVKPDLLSHYIENANANNKQMTDQQLRDVVINFIVAGRDTTAVLLSWATYELTQHPEWQSKLYTAICEVLNNNTNDYTQCATLPLIQAFIHEILRLHPSVPTDSKQALCDDILPDGTFVAKGTVVRYSPYLFGRSKSLWGDDSDEFKPERWLDSATRTGIKEVSQYKFITFNAGPRLCLGKSVALHESSLLLCHLVHRYTFELTANQPITYAVSITQPIKNGLKVYVTKREHSK